MLGCIEGGFEGRFKGRFKGRFEGGFEFLAGGFLVLQREEYVDTGRDLRGVDVVPGA